jgi:hypothetical protein
MKNEPSLYYTNVCWFCGTIYKSNRSTSKYCSKKHNSLYAKYGSQFKSYVNIKGQIFDFENVFLELYSTFPSFNEDWCGPFLMIQLQEFGYFGPFPKDDKTFLVGSFLLSSESRQLSLDPYRYFFKPFKSLTFKEKIILNIVDP